MQYVYLLQSLSSDERYVGKTSDLKRRFAEHNARRSPYALKFAPWQLVTYVAFSDGDKALGFACHLKSGSGHAFAKKRLW
jgi:predicted GIY-YIG superfamily endonuclease